MGAERIKVAGIGELLWDILPGGKQLGGAPCNFAYHALQAGCEAFVISALGADKNGDEILQLMDQMGLDSSYIQSGSEYPTGTVSVKLDAEGKPEYSIHENVAWDHMAWEDRMGPFAEDMDAVCFGSLAQRSLQSRQTIRSFIKATRAECLRIYDVNLRQSYFDREAVLYSLGLANVLKLNEEELPVLCTYLGYEGTEEQVLQCLLDDFQLQLIALTKGDKGSVLLTQDQKSHKDVPVIDLVDTVGAGDSFAAILISGMLRGLSLDKIHTLANEMAAYVCSSSGATPHVGTELLNKIREN